MYTRREESSGEVSTSPEALFELLDDHNRLSVHMTRRSWKMLWGKMNILPDAQHGRAAGSHIVLSGRILGLSLFLDEVVTVREPPLRKRWETVGEPRLLVIGAYAMEFEITPRQAAACLKVRIEYDLPGKGVSRVLGRIFGKHYANWCTGKMVRDAQRIFARLDYLTVSNSSDKVTAPEAQASRPRFTQQ